MADFLLQYRQPIKATTSRIIITTTTIGMTTCSTGLLSSLSDVPTVTLGVMVADVLLVTEDVTMMMSTIVLGATISTVVEVVPT